MPKLNVQFMQEESQESDLVDRGRFSGSGVLNLGIFTRKLAGEMGRNPSNSYREFLRRKLNPPKRARNDVRAMERMYVERFDVNPLHGFLCWQFGIRGAERHIVSGPRIKVTEEMMASGEWY